MDEAQWEDLMTTSTGITVTLDAPFDAAVQQTRDALKAEGFGVLTEIDVRATFQAKLGRDFRPYLILGACNPPLAWAALNADAEVGLLLPCNVTVEDAGAGKTTVRLVDPIQMLAASGPATNPAITEVAEEARIRLEGVAKALAR